MDKDKTTSCPGIYGGGEMDRDVEIQLIKVLCVIAREMVHPNTYDSDGSLEEVEEWIKAHAPVDTLSDE